MTDASLPEDESADPVEGADPLAGIEVPDDIGGLTGPDPEAVLLLTQIAGAEALAAACAIASVDAIAVPTDVGAIAELADVSGDAPERAAAALTSLVRGVPIIVVERSAGQLAMTRWQDGTRGDQLPPGLVLSGASDELEDLITGTTAVGGLPGAVASSSISRWKAMRMLAAQARRARKK